MAANPLYYRENPPELFAQSRLYLPAEGVYVFKKTGLYLSPEEVCTFVRKRSVPFAGRGLYLYRKGTDLLDRKVRGVWSKSTGGLNQKYRGFDRKVQGAGKSSNTNFMENMV